MSSFSVSLGSLALMGRYKLLCGEAALSEDHVVTDAGLPKTGSEFGCPSLSNEAFRKTFSCS